MYFNVPLLSITYILMSFTTTVTIMIAVIFKFFQICLFLLTILGISLTKKLSATVGNKS